MDTAVEYSVFTVALQQGFQRARIWMLVYKGSICPMRYLLTLWFSCNERGSLVTADCVTRADADFYECLEEEAAGLE